MRLRLCHMTVVPCPANTTASPCTPESPRGAQVMSSSGISRPLPGEQLRLPENKSSNFHLSSGRLGAAYHQPTDRGAHGSAEAIPGVPMDAGRLSRALGERLGYCPKILVAPLEHGRIILDCAWFRLKQACYVDALVSRPTFV